MNDEAAAPGKVAPDDPQVAYGRLEYERGREDGLFARLTSEALDAAKAAFNDGVHHDLGLRAALERALRAALAAAAASPQEGGGGASREQVKAAGDAGFAAGALTQFGCLYVIEDDPDEPGKITGIDLQSTVEHVILPALAPLLGTAPSQVDREALVRAITSALPYPIDYGRLGEHRVAANIADAVAPLLNGPVAASQVDRETLVTAASDAIREAHGAAHHGSCCTYWDRYGVRATDAILAVLAPAPDADG